MVPHHCYRSLPFISGIATTEFNQYKGDRRQETGVRIIQVQLCNVLLTMVTELVEVHDIYCIPLNDLNVERFKRYILQGFSNNK